MALMGLIKFLKRYFSVFKKAYKKNDVLFSLATDGVTTVAIVGLILMVAAPLTVWLNSLKETIESMGLENTTDPSVAASLLPVVKSILFKTAAVSLIGFIVIISLYYSSRLFLWKRLTKSKSPSEMMNLRIKRYAKYVVVSIIKFVVFILLPLFILAVQGKNVQASITESSKYLMFGGMMILYYSLYLHFETLYNYCYSRTTEVFSSLKESIILGSRYINHFIFPYFVMGIVFGLVLTVIGFLNQFLIGWYLPVTVIILLVLISTVFRLYTARLIAIMNHRYQVEEGKGIK